MARIRCFFLEETDRVSVKLRRYTRENTPDCCPHYPGKYSYHTTSSQYLEEPVEFDEKGYTTNGVKPVPSHSLLEWPIRCACGYEFQEEDEWQRFTQRIYRRTDTGEEMVLHDAPAGAMWYTPWIDQFHVPQGKHCLAVKTPGGEWAVDSQASNCTMPEDTKQEKHHCWIRSGAPPDVNVDKNGVTCGAGAGSIQCGSYHGFLKNGYLED